MNIDRTVTDNEIRLINTVKKLFLNTDYIVEKLYHKNF